MSTQQRREMLQKKGVNLEAENEGFLNGWIVEKQETEQFVEYVHSQSGEIKTSPEPVKRSSWVVQQAPSLFVGGWLEEKLNA